MHDLDRSTPPTDSLSTLETPEGVALRLAPAGPAVRGLAWCFDLVLRTVAYSVIGTITAFLGSAGGGVFLICVFLGEWFYPVFFELRRGSATPGKRILGLRVVSDDGTAVDLQASVLRNLLRFADFLPAFYGFGIVSCILHPQHKRLGDLTAGTLVVHVSPETDRAAITVDAIAPPVPLGKAESRAIVDYARRSDQWTPERSLELASILRPVLGVRGNEARKKLLGIASWITGHR